MTKFNLLTLIFIGSTSLSFGYVEEDLMEMSLSELLNMEVEVEVASKNAEKIWDAPGVVSVINEAEITQFGANNLIDLLNRVTSVYMLNSYFSPNNFASFRGDSQTNYDNHVLLLLNGRPMRESMNGSFNAPIYQAFPIASLNRIEVIRGPGSALYGAGAYSGVINLVTGPKHEGVQLQANAGSFSGKGAQITYNGKAKNLDFLVAGSYMKEDGWNFEAVDENGTAQSIDFGEENYSFLTTLAYGDWSLETMAVNSTYDYWGTLPVGEGMERDITRIFANLGWKKKLGPVTTEANLTYNRMDIRDGSKNMAEDTLFEVTAFYSPTEKINLTLGGLVNKQTGEFDVVVPDYSATDSSYYAQIEYRPTKALKLITGGQLNILDNGDSDFVPRFGTVLHLTEGTGFKALHGEAFRNPARVETDFNVPPIISGNPDLVPEKVATSELQFFHEGKAYQTAFTYFHTKQKNLIGRVFTPNGPSLFTYNNLGVGNFQGLEFEGKYSPSDKWYTTFSLTYQENEDGEGVEGFSTMPTEYAKLGVVRNFGKRLKLAVFDTYFGKAEGAVATNPNVANVNPSADAFHLVSANLEYALPSLGKMKGMKLDLFAQNLLDEDTFQPEFVRRRINTIPAYPGRSVYLKLNWMF